ncbi:GTP pyrophosphokinase [Abditibacteriota bacterium]|nr:GTP pyrophosphokinase [Abditibacteriota bacterium]
MKPTLEDTLLFAAEKHRGQRDKAGNPYIFHPIRVMENLGPKATESEQMAALLHDIVEDCGVSLDDLRARGYPEDVVGAVALLTKNDEGQRDYQKAIERVAPNPIARRVKIADLTDNLRLDRIPNPTPKDEGRLEKYRAAKAYLESL